MLLCYWFLIFGLKNALSSSRICLLHIHRKNLLNCIDWKEQYQRSQGTCVGGSIKGYLEHYGSFFLDGCDIGSDRSCGTSRFVWRTWYFLVGRALKMHILSFHWNLLASFSIIVTTAPVLWGKINVDNFHFFPPHPPQLILWHVNTLIFTKSLTTRQHFSTGSG